MIKALGVINNKKSLDIIAETVRQNIPCDLLKHYIETAFYFNGTTKDENLIAVCENSLKEKYSKSYLG